MMTKAKNLPGTEEPKSLETKPARSPKVTHSTNTAPTTTSTTPNELARIIEETVDHATHSTGLLDDRAAYYDEETNTPVITDPNSSDGATVFKPDNGLGKFDELK